MAWWPLKKRMFWPRLQRGRQAEALARALLQANGYVLEQVNARFPIGEIDVVAREGSALCFVEVRSTSSQQWGGPLGSITDRKRRRLVHAAAWYLRYRKAEPDQVRFDVVAIEWRAGAEPAASLIRGAFTAD